MEKCKLLVPGYLNYIQVLLYQVQVFHNGILTVDYVHSLICLVVG